MSTRENPDPRRVAGGKKASKANKAEHGEDFYKKIGAMGGKSGKAQGTIKGFGLSSERARLAGAMGGRKSRKKGPNKKKMDKRV